MNRRARLSNRAAVEKRGFPDLSAWPGSGMALPRAARRAEKPLSALEIGVDHLGKVLDRDGAVDQRPIDEKCRGRLHFELVHGALTHAFHGIPGLLIRQAGVETLLGEAGLLGDRHQRRDRFFDRPLPLLAEQRVDHGIIFVLVVLGGAMREHERRARQIVEREIAQDVADLAGVDVALLKFRECRLLEMRAVRAGHRGIFDDGDRRLVVAQGQIGQRIRLHQVGGGHRFRQRIARERRQHRCAEHGGGERYGDGALTEFTSGDMQLMLRGLLARAEWELASSILQLWQWRAALPRSRKGSLSLDGRTQAGERLAQVLVLDRRQAGGDTGGDLRIGRRWRGRRLAPAQRRLPQGDTADRLPAEEAVDPLQDHRRQMLNFERRRAFHPQHQGGRFRNAVVHVAGRICAWPGDLHRLAMGGDFGACDIGPAGDDFGRSEALRLEAVAQGRAQELRKRPGKTARGLVHLDFSMAHDLIRKPVPTFRDHARGSHAIVGAMSVAVRLPRRKKAEAPDPTDLLAWYDRHRRVLPWRARHGEKPDPYRVWLSEIMLQQTTVKTVAPYYARFLARWPTVTALAATKLDDVLRAWAGLGYYARARNLHSCARAVMERHGGIFPNSIEALRALPGIGDYTAAAVAAIAFDALAVPVDGNVERVVSRLFAIEDELPAAKPTIKRLAASLLPEQRAQR